jgi:ABC-type Fe3+/spermidine/putrescine transport system ATPase subunit
MTKLVITNVGRDYGNTAAVEDFSLDIAAGEFISLLGPSGCGKTTMLRMIAGFIEPTRGTIALNGQIISSPSAVLPPEQRSMSMIFQSYAIWPNMTVYQNVAFGLELRKVPSSEIRKRVGDMLEVVQLTAQASRYPAELSGGQQQRVALARAVIVQPEVLLLDEPLSNLDANLREEMRLEIRRMHNEFKITTVYVTHDQAEAMVASDRIVVMSKGRVEQIASPREIYRAPATRFVASFIGRTNFLTGRRNGAEFDFGAFKIPSDSVLSVSGKDQIVVSLRPHSISIVPRRLSPAEGRLISIDGSIMDRAYFGDHWDYTVKLADNSTLIASVEPYLEYQIGNDVSLDIDPQYLSVLTDART